MCRSGAPGSAHLRRSVRAFGTRRPGADRQLWAGPAQAEPGVRWSADRRFGRDRHCCRRVVMCASGARRNRQLCPFLHGAVRADGDVGEVLGPGLHINRGHRVAGGSGLVGEVRVGNEGGLAVRPHPSGSRHGDVDGVLGPGLHVNRRDRPAAVVSDEGVLPSGVTAIPNGPEPTVMSVGCLVLVFTSIVDTELLSWLVTKAVLPSGVTAPVRPPLPRGPEPHPPAWPPTRATQPHEPTGSATCSQRCRCPSPATRRDRHLVRQGADRDVGGRLALVFTSIVYTVPLHDARPYLAARSATSVPSTSGSRTSMWPRPSEIAPADWAT